MASKQPKSKDKPYLPKISKPRTPEQLRAAVTVVWAHLELLHKLERRNGVLYQSQREWLVCAASVLEWALGEENSFAGVICEKRQKLN